MEDQEQLVLDLDDNTIQRKFEEFDAANPRVYEMYKRFALQLWGTGRRKAGIGLITERIRWEVALTTTDEDFKINNNFRSRYARKLMTDVPQLAGFFEIRELKTA